MMRLMQWLGQQSCGAVLRLTLGAAAVGVMLVPTTAAADPPPLAGIEAVTRSTPAGFYSFGSADTPGGPLVVYVIPAGQVDQVPAVVRGYPIVRAFEAPGGHPGLDFGTTVVLGPEAALTIPPERLATPTTAATRRRAPAKASTPDGYGCEEVSFCLYDRVGWTGVFLTLQGYGTGWFNLDQFGFDNRAWSMRNRRNNDSLLASGYWGAGDYYCADSHSSDSTFTNNAIDVNRASSSALVPDDIHC